MRIGIVCYPTYGGSGIVATELAKGLARRGHHIHLISYDQPIRMAGADENLCFHKVEVTAYPLFRFPPYSLEVTATIVHLADTAGLDLVHAHYAIPHGSSALDARLILRDDGRRLPFTITLHGTDITVVGSEPSMKRVVRYLLDHADGVTAVSRSLAVETAQAFRTDRPIDVIPNFIDPAEFDVAPDPCLRRRLAPNDERILMHASNFRPVKNIPHLLEMFRRVVDRMPARLVLVGDGPERARAEELCRELGLAGRVVFPGMRSNIKDFLSVADVYVMASRTESFGLSALEAMACGVPVVAYAVGGVPEVVADGETGVLVPAGDPAALAEACLDLLGDDARRRRLATAAGRRAREVFSVDQVVPLYEAHYRAILAGE